MRGMGQRVLFSFNTEGTEGDYGAHGGHGGCPMRGMDQRVLFLCRQGKAKIGVDVILGNWP